MQIPPNPNKVMSIGEHELGTTIDVRCQEDPFTYIRDLPWIQRFKINEHETFSLVPHCHARLMDQVLLLGCFLRA